MAPVEEPPFTYKNLAGIKTSVKDESLGITGYSNEPEPVPLFAHECAGLYEDDEIPGAEETDFSNKTNGRFRTQNNEDFDDPTLEKFPSTRDEIISTVRNVETGLNEDRTSVYGVPPSPLFRAEDRDSSPTSNKNLDVPVSPGQKPVAERSLSGASLGSIAEGGEGEEERPKVAEIAPAVEQMETANFAIDLAKKAEGEIPINGSKPALKPLVTVPSPSVQAETGLLSPASTEDEAVVLKSAKGRSESTDTGLLTPERIATPKPDEPGSPREPPPNTAPPIVQQDDLEMNTEATPPPTAPRSPQILVSKADDDGGQEIILPGTSTDPSSKDNNTITTHNGESNAHGASKDSQDSQHPTPSTSISRGLDFWPDDVASSTAVEGNQGGSLKKRTGGNKSPIGRADTPNSITGPTRDAAKNGNWFSAFFRLIFVDFVGGIVSRLCGGRRKA